MLSSRSVWEYETRRETLAKVIYNWFDIGGPRPALLATFHRPSTR
jgi:hypothetical protein